MNKLTTQKPTAAITGLRIRYDVPTKCRIVRAVLLNRYPTKADLTDAIENLAIQYNVSPMSIKIWCAKYADTHEQGIKLPAGVMAFTPNPLVGKIITDVNSKLEELRNKQLVIKRKHHPESGKTPREVLDDLILDKEQ